MDYQTFLSVVEQSAHVPEDEAGRVACRTLHTLGHRISAGEAEDLAERLPEELRACIMPEGRPEKFDAEEFLRRLEHDLEVDRATAELDAKAVLAALWTAVGPDEFADMRSQLPKDFDPLLDGAVAQAPPSEREPVFVGPYDLDEFIDRVAERAGLDRDRARRAAEAVLEVLAMRVTAGEIEDIEPNIPRELRRSMERGIARSGRRALAMPFDAFVREVARLEGTGKREALEHARAVFSTLREAIGEKEWHDLRAQLPADYRELWRQPNA